MSFREFSHRYLEPGSQWAMVLGIVFLCQPWIEVLHQYSVTLMLIGIVAFNVAVHVPKPVKPKEDDAGPVSVKQVVKEGAGHG
jgi:hypothetical protein